MKNTDKIFIIGFMGTGKTSVSKELAMLLNWDFIDIDQLIEKNSGIEIKEIFEKYGEDYFRTLETEALEAVSKSQNSVVSCGGGLITRDCNIAILKKSGTTILLHATPETIYNRLKDDNSRPLLKDNININYISKMLENREELYNKAADITIITDNKSVSDIALEIIKQIRGE